jgi:hypothetical protein
MASRGMPSPAASNITVSNTPTPPGTWLTMPTLMAIA